jgi:hypothetical protein
VLARAGSGDIRETGLARQCAGEPKREGAVYLQPEAGPIGPFRKIKLGITLLACAMGLIQVMQAITLWLLLK